jgi:hypothetical protein
VVGSWTIIVTQPIRTRDSHLTSVLIVVLVVCEFKMCMHCIQLAMHVDRWSTIRSIQVNPLNPVSTFGIFQVPLSNNYRWNWWFSWYFCHYPDSYFFNAVSSIFSPKSSCFSPNKVVFLAKSMVNWPLSSINFNVKRPTPPSFPRSSGCAPDQHHQLIL